jgi:hypothetical protein
MKVLSQDSHGPGQDPNEHLPNTSLDATATRTHWVPIISSCQLAFAVISSCTVISFCAVILANNNQFLLVLVNPEIVTTPCFRLG